MVDERVVDYIKKSLAAGVSSEQITISLKQQGWNDLEIYNAMEEAKISVQTPVEEPEPQKPVEPSMPKEEPRQPQAAKKIPTSHRFHIRGRPVPTKMIIVLVAVAIVSILIAAFFLFQGVPIGESDCSRNIGCFIAASKSCTPATMEYGITTNVFSSIVNSNVLLEIKGTDVNGCVLYLQIGDIEAEISDELKQIIIENGATYEQVEMQQNQMNIALNEFEGDYGTCTFASTADLTNALNNIASGIALISYEMDESGLKPSADALPGAVCEGDFFG
jgi:hypothetical protein